MRRCRSRSGEGSPGTGDKMPKHGNSKWRQPFWFVVFASFSLSFLLLFYLYRSSSLVKHNAVTIFDRPGYGFSHSVVDYGTIISDHFDNERHDVDDADDDKPEKPEPDDKPTDDDVETDKDDDTFEVTEEADDGDDSDDDANDQDSVSETEDEEKSEIDEKSTTGDREIERNSSAGNVSVRVTGEEESCADDADHSVSATEGSGKHEKNLTDQGSNTTKVEKLRINGTTTSNLPDQGSNTTEVERLRNNGTTTSNGTVTGHDSVSHSGRGFASEKLQVEKPKTVDNSTRNATKSIEGRKHLNVHNDRAQYLDHGNSVSNQNFNHTATKLEEHANSANGHQNETSYGGSGVRENAKEINKSDSGQRVAEKLPYKMMNPEPTKGSVREATNRGKSEEAHKTDGSKRVNETAVKHNDTLKVSDNLNTSNVDPCRGQYIYIHKLPSRFNEDMIMNCKSLSKWLNMCDYITNYGLGPELDNTLPEFSAGGWFTTNQFALELIFHHRMNQYKCLTKDSTKASAIFVPYYSGLDVSRYLWHDKSLKDSAALDLVAWLRDQDEWKRMWGRDHFFVAGRITWDFRREGDNLGNWGNKLMYLPESKNMTILTIESSPWHRNDFAVPYPSYFHPKTDDEIRLWQHKVRKMKRKYLFSFAGGLRPNLRNDVRGAIFNQCEAAKHKCSLLECVEGDKTCYEPANLMNLFESSVFCLQPPGDSFTRRSTFDSILAGCIPVFFHPGSAYIQYLWHFPRDPGKYSVYIPGKDVKERGVSIERVLSDIPREKVVAMREELIRLIPRITYVYPRFGVKAYEDAFDVAVNGVLERVEVVRKEMEEGKNSSFGFEEEESWKWFRQGRMGKHVWDDLFDRSGDMKFIPGNK